MYTYVLLWIQYLLYCGVLDTKELGMSRMFVLKQGFKSSVK